MASNKVSTLTPLEVFSEFQSSFQKMGLTLSIAIDSSVNPPLSASPDMELNLRWIEADTWSSNKLIVTLGQLCIGFSFPLYNPSNPVLLEILNKLSVWGFSAFG